MTEPKEPEDDLELVDPGSKSQPAEGGRKEADESIAAQEADAEGDAPERE